MSNIILNNYGLYWVDISTTSQITYWNLHAKIWLQVTLFVCDHYQVEIYAQIALPEMLHFTDFKPLSFVTMK